MHAATATVCAHCGTTIDTSEWYPVETATDRDGTLVFHPFCSANCRSAWMD
jgi:endogenous inhibitor of DNA gyrase (YacG/DUF329 family)